MHNVTTEVYIAFVCGVLHLHIGDRSLQTVDFFTKYRIPIFATSSFSAIQANLTDIQANQSAV